LGHFSHGIGLNRALKDKDSFTLLYNMGGEISAAGFKTTIGNVLESKTGTVI
jgi:hypothetical protein